MKILFTFPGQGTQHEGMLQNLPERNWLRRVRCWVPKLIRWTVPPR